MGRYFGLNSVTIFLHYHTFAYSSELTKLWNLYPDNLEACKAKDRNFLPTLENYFADAIDQLESPTPVKDDDNLLKDGNFGWRALRLLARRSPHFFTYSNNPINKLPDYLAMMVSFNLFFVIFLFILILS